MPTDRELDALVAEKVLGWVWQHRTDKPDAYLNGPGWKDVVGTRWAHEHLRNGDGGKPRKVTFGVPAYSTDIAAAWAVVERMREKGWALDIVDEGAFVAWSFRRRYPKMGEPNHGRGRCAWRDGGDARAICLAALRALGEEVAT